MATAATASTEQQQPPAAGTPPAGSSTPPAATPPAATPPASGTPPAAGSQPPAAGGAPSNTPPPAQAQPPARVVPERYDLKVPEAARDYLDDSDVATISALAKQYQLTNEEAQAELEKHADRIAQQSATFRTALEADPHLGGDKLVETQRLGNLVLDRYAPAADPLGKELRQVLVKSGFGNHKAVVAFLAKIGRAMAEDSPSAGHATGERTSADAAAALYDHPDSKALMR